MDCSVKTTVSMLRLSQELQCLKTRQIYQGSLSDSAPLIIPERRWISICWILTVINWVKKYDLRMPTVKPRPRSEKLRWMSYAALSIEKRRIYFWVVVCRITGFILTFLLQDWSTNMGWATFSRSSPILQRSFIRMPIWCMRLLFLEESINKEG